MKEVSASVVRASLGLSGKRGRISATDAQRFNKGNKSQHYTPQGVAEKRHSTIPGVVGLDKAGRKVTKSVTIPTEDARALLASSQGKRGRLSVSTVALALSAQNADAVADSFH